jgi:hypothetical protein
MMSAESLTVDPHQSPIGIKMAYAIPGAKRPRKPSVPCRFQMYFFRPVVDTTPFAVHGMGG